MGAGPEVFKVRCHHCSYFLGECERPLELVGVVKGRALLEKIERPRRSWRCKCGWVNVFKPVEGGRGYAV